MRTLKWNLSFITLPRFLYNGYSLSEVYIMKRFVIIKISLNFQVNVLTQQLKNHSRMHVRVHGAANTKEAALSPTRNRNELT